MYTNDIIILTGSYARGLQTEYSDIDFLVLTENTSRFHTDTIYEDGKEIQIIMVPLYKVQSMVQENTSPLYSVIVSMLKSSVVISDSGGRGQRLVDFADRYKVVPSENVVASMLNILFNRCNELQASKDKLESGLLVSDILILLSHIIFHNFTTSSKSCIRNVCRSNFRDKLYEVYESYRKDDNYLPLLDYVNDIVYKFYQSYHTTGYSPNNLVSNSPIVIYIPQKHICDNRMMEEIINSLEHICTDCNLYAFYQGPLQAMNEGTYIYVSSACNTSSEICSKIKSYDRTIAVSRMGYGIEMVYPYYTTFTSGYMFGGAAVHKKLLPTICSLWKEYFDVRFRQVPKDVQTYTMASAFVVLNELGDNYERHISSKSVFFSNLLSVIIPDVIDRNGYYNVEQTKYLRKATLKSFAEQYEKFGESTLKNISDILRGQIDNMSTIYSIVSELVSVLNTIKKEDMSYPDIYPFRDTWDIFYVELTLHLFAVLQMSEENKFGTIYNLSRHLGLCLEDSLLHGK